MAPDAAPPDGTPPPPPQDLAPPATPASPARAEPHDATAWLPLPDFEELPSIHELLTPDPGVEAPPPRDIPVQPSPARAEPHDATAWLPLPEVDALPEVEPVVEPTDGDGGGGRRGRGRARRHRTQRRGFHVPWRALGAFVLVLGLAGATYWAGSAALDPGADVAIRVDGRVINAETGVSTVGSLLEEKKVVLGEHDKVVPGPSAPIENDMTVRVLRAFPITLDVDGEIAQAFTTTTDPKDFLRELGLGKRVGYLTRPDEITEGMAVAVRTRHTGTLTVDGQVVEFDAPAATIGELLAKYQVVLQPNDFATPQTDAGLEEPLVDGIIVGVTRQLTETDAVVEPYVLPPERRPDPNMDVTAEDRFEPGAPGFQTVTYAITRNNGYEVARAPISAVPVVGQEARPDVTYFGTAYNGLWDKMARCETGGNWSASGQKYQGGLGIFWQNWNHYGGLKFAPTAGQATKLEQIIVAERIRAEHGWRAWGCAKEIGL